MREERATVFFRSARPENLPWGLKIVDFATPGKGDTELQVSKTAPMRVSIHIEKLPEGVYLATSDDIQGLVAQGKTVTETPDIARDVARKLIEAQSKVNLPPLADRFDYPLILSVG